ncbi:hypothetical protein NC651_033650 [Populus alba x Populus x berolinensis]|nr:hypothetical protein NC651_033650 [Populus alba x Populus x berolinensis]
MSWGTLKPLVAKAHPSAKQGLKTFMKTQAVLPQTQWQLRINNHTVEGLLLTLLLTLCPLKWPPLKPGASPPGHKRSKFVDSKQASGPGNYEETLQVKRHYLTRSRANQKDVPPNLH